MSIGTSFSGDSAEVSAIRQRHYTLIVVLVAALIFLGTIVTPPSLMDDVDAVQAQIARNMITSGDWVTPRLNGVIYLEKPPLKYWLIAVSYKIFGVKDWAARLPLALGTVALCWLTFQFGVWAFSPQAGFYAGLCLTTSVGLFLFTRVLISDVLLTLAVALSMWGLLRALDEDEHHPRLWAFVTAAAIGLGILTKGLIAAVFPVGAGLVYLVATRQLFSRRTWQRLHPVLGLAVILLIAAPWHVLATLRNPPYFDFTMRSEPGKYHGFFWFYFLNEHVFRFLNMRYPHDYNTVPRYLFWLLHLVWLFPWSGFFPGLARLNFRPVDRAGHARLLALGWIGFILIFFSFSTTQEYYSMPCYPALALLLGSAMTENSAWIRRGLKAISSVAMAAAVVIVFLLIATSGFPAPADISVALQRHPDAYTLSLGHMGDLTLHAFAYLRVPLVIAGIAFLIGAVGAWRYSGKRAFVSIALMMLLFAHAARLALVAFDPYLSSKPLADALSRAPAGRLIVDDQYYAFSSVFFYANRDALLLNGRINNLQYGSYAPGAPDVFIDDTQFQTLWQSRDRYYLVAAGPALPRFEKLVGTADLHVVTESGGKLLFTNHDPH
jgi:4-amino-4-deoxy-L-arabinose transferase-like glycosyltransferase